MPWQTVTVIVAVLAVICFYHWCDLKRREYAMQMHLADKQVEAISLQTNQPQTREVENG